MVSCQWSVSSGGKENAESIMMHGRVMGVEFGDELGEMRRSLEGIPASLGEMRCSLEGIPASLEGMALPLEGIRRSLGGMALPLEGIRRSLKGMALQLEESSALGSFLADQELYFGAQMQPEELVEKVTAVTATDVQTIANEFFKREHLNLAVVGACKEEEFTPILESAI